MSKPHLFSFNLKNDFQQLFVLFSFLLSIVFIITHFIYICFIFKINKILNRYRIHLYKFGKKNNKIELALT